MQQVDETPAAVVDNKNDNSMDVDEKKEEIVTAVAVDKKDDLIGVEKKQQVDETQVDETQVVADNNSKDNAMNIDARKKLKQQLWWIIVKTTQ